MEVLLINNAFGNWRLSSHKYIQNVQIYKGTNDWDGDQCEEKCQLVYLCFARVVFATISRCFDLFCFLLIESMYACKGVHSCKYIANDTFDLVHLRSNMKDSAKFEKAIMMTTVFMVSIAISYATKCTLFILSYVDCHRAFVPRCQCHSLSVNGFANFFFLSLSRSPVHSFVSNKNLHIFHDECFQHLSFIMQW